MVFKTEVLSLLLTVLVAILLRWCVSMWPYSGAEKPPMYGDYEAQRHWMEITYNLPIHQWYENTTDNDLHYWGLDYPPLTAYHMYLCGYIANWIKPEWVELFTSRGYESYQHKLFMRYSVLLAEIPIYILAVVVYFGSRNKSTDKEKLVSVLCVLLYPGLMLIDHGHFQYNTVSLGLTLWAVIFLSRKSELLGAVAFCLALNYKQMELYHAMPFFCYLLGTCLFNKKQYRLLRFLKLVTIVLLTFTICWWPFIKTHRIETVLQIIRRLFPFARGLYEDKVANIWCSISLIVKLKQIFIADKLVTLCLLSTLICLIPSSLDLLLRPGIQKFKLALVNSSLVFFLFSFQVHEKSILIAALPVCLLLPEYPLVCTWFLLISTTSMFPLFLKEDLVVPCFASMLLFIAVTFSSYRLVNREMVVGSVILKYTLWIMFSLSLIGSLLPCIMSLVISPPLHLPDAFTLLNAMYSCIHFIAFLLYFHYIQLSIGTENQYTLKPIRRPSNIMTASGDHKPTAGKSSHSKISGKKLSDKKRK